MFYTDHPKPILPLIGVYVFSISVWAAILCVIF